MQYSLADLDSIFTETHEAVAPGLEPQTILEQSLMEPPTDFDMLAPDDFLKDVILEPGIESGLDPDLLDVHDMFDDNILIDPDDAPCTDFIDPDEFLIHNYLRNPESTNDEERENSH